MFDKFMCYCDGNTELKSKLEAGKAEKSQLDQELMGHKQGRAAAQNDLKQAQSIRDKEHTEYLSAVGEQKQK